MKNLLLFIVLLYGIESSAQDAPIWDIGTKWTYGYRASPFDNFTSYATDEITDTITINGLKLYAVTSFPEFHGIRYFHYDNEKVYSYNVEYDFLQLLYDFSSTDDLNTPYRPICDPSFDYDNDVTKNYTIVLDTIQRFNMPDSSVRDLKYYLPYDTLRFDGDTSIISFVERRVLDGVGFLEGYLHYTHDWELGDLICDEFGNYILGLRCFETDSVSYNFVGYPCDSVLVETSIEEIAPVQWDVYPNPTADCISLLTEEKIDGYQVLDIHGRIIDSSREVSREICIGDEGLSVLRVLIGNRWYSKLIIRTPD